jgi:DtxR family Mn-dependent transcriptional regulator
LGSYFWLDLLNSAGGGYVDANEFFGKMHSSTADGEELGKPLATLAGLRLREEAEVVALSERCTGLGRRRLLDLGFTAGAQVRAVLANLNDAAHAYEIRGTMIALRKEQAEQILIRPLVAHRRETGINSG